MARISIDEETGRGPGWVRIVIRPALGIASPGISISRRQTDKPYLGPTGWQSQRHVLMPRASQEQEDGTLLLFGPEVTSHIELDDRIDVAVAGTEIQERHHWPNIAPLPPGTTGAVRVMRPAAPPLPPPPPETEKEPAREPTAEPPFSPPPLPPAGTRWPLVAGAALLLLCVVAAGAWYRLREQAPDTLTTEPAVPAPAETAAPPLPVESDAVPSTETETAGPEPVAPEPVASESLADRFQRFRRSQGYANELFQLSSEAQQAGDAGLVAQALGLAAQRGSAEANLEMGRRYDPGIDGEGSGRPEPQPLSAVRYYCRAIEFGNAEARTLLDALKERASAPPREEAELFQDFPANQQCQ